MAIDPKYRDAYSTHIPAVILAVNNNPMRFSDRSGGVSRRRVILHFPEIIPADERDPQLKEKISGELSVIVRQLMQQFSQPQQARSLLQSQQNSDEAMRIKRDADPMVDFCGYLFTTPEPNALYMGNASIRPLQPRRYLYHAYGLYGGQWLQESAQHEDVRPVAEEHHAGVRTALHETTDKAGGADQP